MPSVTIRILGHDLPGLRCAGLSGIAKPIYDDIYVGVQRKREVVEMVPGDASEACWTLEVDVAPGRDGGLDFRGPWAQGKPGERFVYLSWGERDAVGHFEMFRRAKLWLTTIGDDLLRRALDSGAAIEGRLGLTDARGHPLCASVRPPVIAWSLAS
jgi:hypothetical protein